MRCLDCDYFNQEDTCLPVCMLHRRYMHEDWTCGDFKDGHRREDDTLTEKPLHVKED